MYWKYRSIIIGIKLKYATIFRNFGFLKSAKLNNIIITNNEPKTPLAASTCACICVSGKIPTKISDMDAKIPNNIPNISRILLKVSRGFQEYNRAKKGINIKPEIIHPMLKKIAPTGFKLTFPRLLSHSYIGLYVTGYNRTEISVKIVYITTARRPVIALIEYL